ncbi:hypothetical protein FRACYDRAFT_237966 [Fragilariopsis cylindrus CCMP1102]|uniref:Uncharacterized protein n=1 Tax=Fragilariopsis cylindrus CCMP1102 TaxID=635003 RepID=A0A1E7FHD4_9STRA|nr:hypothetical protein FRACYDRAFT_237966 [Fragilariopsis cylindrus CCMP1102]|eukprot:OEU17547.1 hypothetical protein FRACYDRAFT_237966 [Fragilariopsis cylindrus CCMP1102]
MGATESVFEDTTTEPASTTSSNAASVGQSRDPIPSRSQPNGVTKTMRKPHQRRPPSQAKPIKRMEGVVLGCPKTGKRTLLKRLEDSTTWDRIKLRIQYANSNFYDEKIQTKNKIDFVVILINPKHPRDMVQSHLTNVLNSYLDLLGHLTNNTIEKEKEEKMESSTSSNNNNNETSSTTTNITEPFCMIVLFNFRDLQKEEGKDELSHPVVKDTERFIRETLRSRNVPEENIVLDLLNTSLRNCYGLDGLHRFIYRTYLQRCRADIERQVNVVRNKIQITNLADTVPMKYDEFIEEITPKEIIEPQRAEQKQQSSRRSLKLQSNKQSQPQGQTSSARMGKEALAAFLASKESPIEITSKLNVPEKVETQQTSEEDDNADAEVAESLNEVAKTKEITNHQKEIDITIVREEKEEMKIEAHKTSKCSDGKEREEQDISDILENMQVTKTGTDQEGAVDVDVDVDHSDDSDCENDHNDDIDNDHNDDNNDEKASMISPEPVEQKVDDDEDDDDDEYGGDYTTGSTHDNEAKEKDDTDDDDDNDLMIGSMHANENLNEYDSDDDSGYMIQSNSPVQKNEKIAESLSSTKIPSINDSIEKPSSLNTAGHVDANKNSSSVSITQSDDNDEESQQKDEILTIQPSNSSLAMSDKTAATKPAATSSGISAAALAAIAAAQQEAEAMMQQQQQQQQPRHAASHVSPIKEKKSKKKKKKDEKDGEKKKKKKRKAKVDS